MTRKASRVEPSPRRDGGTLVALLRGVNVGGAGRLLMTDLTAICRSVGFLDVRTYIQSGNVVFRSVLDARGAQDALERRLATEVGPIGVVVRTAAALSGALDANPFPDAPPARVMVFFSSDPVSQMTFRGLATPGGEIVVPRREEIYVFYPDGQGQSKLKLPKMPGVITARNVNTVRKLVEMSRG